MAEKKQRRTWTPASLYKRIAEFVEEEGIDLAAPVGDLMEVLKDRIMSDLMSEKPKTRKKIDGPEA